MKDFLILGADGQQGVIATKYLRQHGYSLALADIYGDNIEKEFGILDWKFCDHRNPTHIIDLIKATKPKVVLNCANDFYNDVVLNACVFTHTHYIDLGSDIPGTQRRLNRHNEARSYDITAILGCGSVPGIGSVMMKHLAQEFDTIDYAESGFAWDSNMPDFVPPFFLFVVLLELSLPAIQLRNGELFYTPPMKEKYVQRIQGVGDDYELYVVPHSEVYSFHHYFKHKGLQNYKFLAGFPAHSREVINSLIRAGLNRYGEITVQTAKGPAFVEPCDFLTAAAKKIPTPEGYEERENLWTTVNGKKNGIELFRKMECIVPPVKGYERFGCNVDTAFPACIIAEMVLKGEIAERGVFCPEAIVPCEPFFQRIQQEGMRFTRNNDRVDFDS